MKDSKDEGYIKGMPRRQAINYGVGLRFTFYKDISIWEGPLFLFWRQFHAKKNWLIHVSQKIRKTGSHSRKKVRTQEEALSFTRTTSNKNDNKLCKFHPFHVKEATKRRKHFFDVRSYIYRRDSWANICQFTDFLILPVCVEPYIIIVTRKWCYTWLCTLSVDVVCARLVLVPPGSKAAAWKWALSPQPHPGREGSRRSYAFCTQFTFKRS